MEIIHKSNVDVAVLLVFFARPYQTSQVFAEIKRARPSKLFLYQDGPRDGRESDIENIAKCREIVEQIDWECEIYRKYQEKNVGCDPSGFIAHTWMFSLVEKGIVLEDDVVPAQSFFPFCKELLDKYEHDERINIICGMNNVDVTDSPYDYIFSRRGSIWGWASWRRVVDEWDSTYSFLDDNDAMRLLKPVMGRRFDNRISASMQHRASGKAHFETILGLNLYLRNRINIVPSKNMISNIGLTEDTTHAVSSIDKLPRAIRGLFFMKRYEIEWPIKHPKYIIEDLHHQKRHDKIMIPNPIIRFLRTLEYLLYMFLPFLGK